MNWKKIQIKWVWILVVIIVVGIILYLWLTASVIIGINECELYGGKCYGFGDFVAETCEDHGMMTLSRRCPTQITLNTQCCKK